MTIEMKSEERLLDEDILLFCNKVRELRKSRLITTKEKCFSYQKHFDPDDDEDLDSLPFPPDEYIQSFLLNFRHFVSQKSPIYLFKILSRAYLVARNSRQKEMIALFRKHISSAMFGELPEAVRESLIGNNTDEILKLFLNGKYFHLDKKFRRKIESLKGDLEGNPEILFLTAIYSITSMIFLTSMMLEEMFDVNNGN